VPTQNANWPLLQVLWSPTTNAVYDSNLPVYTDITLRCLQSWTVQRGRQYELDQMQPGTLATTLNNRDGAFNPVSSASPFAPGVLPERSIKVQAQWPPTANLLPGDLATSGEVTPLAPGSIPASLHINSDVGATLTIASSTSAYQGSQVFQAAVPASISTGFYILKANYTPIQAKTIATPTTTYTWSTYVRCTTASINPQVAAAVKWYGASGTAISSSVGSTVTLTGSATASWTRIAVTGTPPAGALYATLAVAAEGTPPASAWTFQQDGLQLEAAGSASSWTAPGTWYPIFAGNVDRYPNTYDLSGTRALATIEASDGLGLLSQSLITASLDGLIANPAGDNSLAGAIFNYWLGDSGGNQYSDQLGNRNYGAGLPGKYGIGTITAGIPVTSSIAGESFQGTVQTCVSFTSSAGAGQGPGAAMSPNGLYGPGGGTGLGYTRMIAFRCTAAPTSGSVLWYSGAAGNYAQGFALFPSGVAAVSVVDPNHLSTTTVGTYDIGGWHLAWLGVAADGSSFLAGVDNSIASYSAGATHFSYPQNFLDELIGAQGYSVSNPNWIAYNFTGDLALYVEWPELLTTAAMTSIYQAWRTGYTGDSSGQRAAHILNWAHYVGATAIDTGSTTSLAAATDVDQTDAVTALQDVVATEGGEHFVARDGTYTFYGRSRRLGVYTPVYNFGTNVTGGEIPFEDVQFDFDPTLVENDVTNTQTSTTQNFYAVNETSAATFGKRSYTQSNQSSNVEDVQDQADWIAGVYGYPRLRVASLTLHPAANPSLLWPVCLSLELGMYVKVTQRPMGQAVGAVDAVTMNGFIENIMIVGQNTADATWVLQISPDVASGGGPSQSALEPWNLALLHATLNTAASAGTNTITINALPTAATSTLAQNLPQGGPGFQLTIGSGLATQETLTIASVSTTTLGYTTATITFTANLANNHAANEIVRETLGAANPATWQNLDAYSTLGTCMIAY
jgi:hypothetical protein